MPILLASIALTACQTAKPKPPPPPVIVGETGYLIQIFTIDDAVVKPAK